MENQYRSPKSRSRVRTYLLVFIALAIITAVEIALTTVSISRQTLTLAFLALSIAKASLVAAFFMHLRSDSRLYTYIFLLPTIMFILFALLTVAS
jgi:cytochrome c oxidase subunit 4